ncbi:hypothetical protein HRR83_009243 [Exophiala dermatitidis]|uniref:Uncharacterized protein n=2 Tax=Exophiala dermatitidis TaxID=5970 RepID=H6BP05_EXODN|nr:uncharacterized protein HMPREF1120_00635 [Exophiala dermatitidis NIH/UT8656]KAJ4502530.1 hypothetical protein HRR73_009398 [Exophiala dermatitidis]EHY52423.1 hypothetical protein HMPREF1120_00635 [Exophiala dermatitidis NIH/UT8656]KAJ4503017.1 hypothetical protein HRR74_009406 [Exophiala dermatitidis]KAJ4531631.1 hypothetical protein HRR77_009283 [Exophiala dermatitidis]KAJ4548035.1 hypothetical protein HRR76_000653 [Exophiala dermatitidis]
MADRNAPPSPPPQHRRRSSFIDMFTPRTHAAGHLSSSPPSTAVPTTPGATQQHRRGTSITALGLSTSAGSHTSPMAAFHNQRRASVATSSASSSPEFKNSFGDEPAVIEEDDPARATLHPPASPSFARRVSFGAQALRETSRLPGSPGTSVGGEGFNWSEAIRERSRRSPSFSSGNPLALGQQRPRAASISNPEPPKEIVRPVEPPPAPQRLKKPDHLGERMLRGDFMMD